MTTQNPMTRWLDRHEQGKPGPYWTEVTPLYSCRRTRLVYVLDMERGVYPVIASDLKLRKPEEKRKRK